MTDSTALLLKLINEGKTINEISETLGISHKKIYNILTMIRNKGFEFDRKYYYNGDMVYVPKMSFIEMPREGVDIITTPEDQNFEALVISDIHIGSVKERLELLNFNIGYQNATNATNVATYVRVYDYCVKEGIHIIIVCGDIIDGMYGPNEKYHDNISDQIDYALKNYPFDKGILNFATLGDHDYDAMRNYGQNLAKVFESYRHDIIPLGYCIGQINIKNDKIYVRHPSDKFDEVKLQPMHRCLMLNGHSHKMGISASNNTTTVTVPALCDIQCPTDAPLPTAIRMNLEFNNGMIYHGTFSQLLVDKGVYRLNEFECPLGYGKDISGNTSVRLEETRIKKKVLELPKEEPKIELPKLEDNRSQIEKFNARWKL